MIDENTNIYGELLTVGDELLSGRTVNNNAAHLGHHLRLAGFQLRWVTVVGDRQEDITAALVGAIERAGFVLVTGGLGPTEERGPRPRPTAPRLGRLPEREVHVRRLRCGALQPLRPRGPACRGVFR